MTLNYILNWELEGPESAEKWYCTSTGLFNNAEHLYHDRFIFNKEAIHVKKKLHLYYRYTKIIATPVKKGDLGGTMS